MYNTDTVYPFWRTKPQQVWDMLHSLKKGQVHHLCKSAGGYDIPYATYGEKQDYRGTANYNSACGARNPKYYADREGRKPTIMLIGATHAQELEGVMALMNLFSLLETGRDLRGEKVPSLLAAYEECGCRLVIVPIHNMDGRMRCEPDSMLGETHQFMRYHGQGTWKDGTLCEWPDCKTVHPLKDAVDFLGAYYNDDGVNLMHDDQFCPMAEETKAILRLAKDECPEAILALHGGSNVPNCLLQTSYVPDYIHKAIRLLAEETAALAEARGLPNRVDPVPDKPESFPPPSFNLTTALHHVCGAVSCSYECNQGMIDPWGRYAFTAEEMLLHHYSLFEAAFRRPWKELTPFFCE
ncbi:MAG: hypothetical protein IKY52_01920 [Clostridia bacterium]|nr:hypothetical protein [Clostridia bacterium]